MTETATRRIRQEVIFFYFFRITSIGSMPAKLLARATGGVLYLFVLFFRFAWLAHDIAVFIRITAAVFPQQLIELVSGPVEPDFNGIQAY